MVVFRFLIFLVPIVAFVAVLLVPFGDNPDSQRIEDDQKHIEEGEALLLLRQMRGFDDTRMALFECHWVADAHTTNTVIANYNARNEAERDELETRFRAALPDASKADLRKIQAFENNELYTTTFQRTVRQHSSFEVDPNGPSPTGGRSAVALRHTASGLLGFDLTAANCASLFEKVQSGERDFDALEIAVKSPGLPPLPSANYDIDSEAPLFLGADFPAHTAYARYTTVRNSFALCYGVLDNEFVHRTLETFIQRNDPKMVKLIALKRVEWDRASAGAKAMIERDWQPFVSDANTHPMVHEQYYPGSNNRQFDALDAHTHRAIPERFMTYLDERNVESCGHLAGQLQSGHHDLIL